MAKFKVKEILMGRAEFDDLPLELQSNLLTLQGRLNEFFANYTAPAIISSGYRPLNANSNVGGAAKSWHLKCAAADIRDIDGSVWQYVLKNLKKASELGLWFEDKRWTPTWVHCQIYPPGSGARIYVPSSAPAAAPKAWDGIYDRKLDSKLPAKH